MYRPQIKVLDCTIRDGGLINKHDFDDDFVRDTYRSLSAAGVDYVELGYKNSPKLFCPKEYGKWKFCQDDDIRYVIDGVDNGAKISVMADIGRVDLDAINEVSQSPVDMIRVACYAKDVDKAIAMVNEFEEKGYETTINIMAISKNSDMELEEALQQIEEESKTSIVYVVDSFGAMYQETIEFYVKKYQSILKTKELGIHAHNNMQLGFSNTIESIIHGVNYLDATVYGIGRAAGNCPVELLVDFLKNPKFDTRPILDLISRRFIPLRNEIEWGYILPYAVTGMFNEHPRTAMALRDSEERDNYAEFYTGFLSE